MPVRSNAAFLDAENVVLCSDFEELSASRVSLFLRELGKEVVAARILDGPMSLGKTRDFNVLAVISGIEIKSATQECAIGTVPYGNGVVSEIQTTANKLLDGFEHPNPVINAALGDTLWVSSNYYHRSLNWITVVIAIRAPSAHQLDFTMMRLFDLPETTCSQNLACLAR
ncbi:hypothetical protein PhaeoP18_02299 [Phaeobacter piscinae]|uniref:Uncharacterized protein n=1 Tax=Phaeobacter piscinae TaxID=1580596 RepID=A0AAN1GS93_9RHOB|nr:hypothetical protein [Phaeobacter piscinae]ATG44242.1 hypothetical protein PhaeoP13_02321 [Phaeobacter piscinae]AUR36555.1 hypothetical protein PhaeoP18_02299 [Phaeobacter piscinae]